MITQYDLYDITAALVRIRSDLYNQMNIIVLKKMEQILVADNCLFEDNQIRKAISSIPELDKTMWGYVYHNNIYVNQRILKDIKIEQLLKNIFASSEKVLKDKKYDQAYDLIDSVHSLPQIIADNNFSVPKHYWRTYVKPYRNKWDRTFLAQEEKNLSAVWFKT